MDKKLLLLVFVFLLIFSTFTGSLFLAKQKRSVRAAKRIPDQSKSLCLSGALSAQIGQPVTVTCVARDNETSAVSGAQCCFTVTSGIGSMSPTCVPTDDSGMGKATLTSTTAGTTNVSCQINGSINAGTVSVAFTQ